MCFPYKKGLTDHPPSIEDVFPENRTNLPINRLRGLQSVLGVDAGLFISRAPRMAVGGAPRPPAVYPALLDADILPPPSQEGLRAMRDENEEFGRQIDRERRAERGWTLSLFRDIAGRWTSYCALTPHRTHQLGDLRSWRHLVAVIVAVVLLCGGVEAGCPSACECEGTEINCPSRWVTSIPTDINTWYTATVEWL